MLLKKPIELGKGAEGPVYRIATNLVCKDWHDSAWCRYNIKSIIRRFKSIEKRYNTLPERVKKKVKLPIFAGYEKDYNDRIFTYHEYIKMKKVNSNKFHNHKIYNILDKKFKDLQINSNVLYSKGIFYLVDVAVRK